MIGLITDRSQANVDRRNALSKKGWNQMTLAERAEWTGDPLLADGGANLLPRGENYSEGVTVKYRDDTILVTSNWDGAYIYAILEVGPAEQYAGRTLTLSLDGVTSSKGAPNVVLYWDDANGAEYAGGGLTGAGSMTFTLEENAAGRASLAMYLYATTDAEIAAGDFIEYHGLMLESGPERHPYVPYYEILPTPATKGAYNYSDLNRVEGATRDLGELAGIALVTKTDWTGWDIPKRADMARILNNIAILRQRFPTPSNSPALPKTMERLTVTAANNIERVLSDIADAVEKTYRAGELYSGEA